MIPATIVDTAVEPLARAAIAKQSFLAAGEKLVSFRTGSLMEGDAPRSAWQRVKFLASPLSVEQRLERADQAILDVRLGARELEAPGMPAGFAGTPFAATAITNIEHSMRVMREGGNEWEYYGGAVKALGHLSHHVDSQVRSMRHDSVLGQADVLASRVIAELQAEGLLAQQRDVIVSASAERLAKRAIHGALEPAPPA